MRKSLMFVWFVASAFILVSQVNAFTVGLVSDGAKQENAEAAYKWAQSDFDAKIIGRPTSKNDLTGFGVVWWDESHAAAIPPAFLEKATLDAFRGYVQDGGGLLLSNLAFHAVFDMGVESGQPRYFGRNDASPLDWTDFQIAKRQENHAIFKGMKMEKGVIQYDIQGWTDGSDFYSGGGPTGPKDGKVLAQVVDGQPQTNPLVEYAVGQGAIVGIGWVWSSFVVNKKLADVNEALHGNIIKYLASKSKFAAVEPNGKVAVSWGSLKTR